MPCALPTLAPEAVGGPPRSARCRPSPRGGRGPGPSRPGGAAGLADALGDWTHQRTHVLGQQPLDEGVRSQRRGKRCFRGAPGTGTRALGRHGGEPCGRRQSRVSAHAQRARRLLAPRAARLPQGRSACAGTAHGPDAPGAPRALAAENPEPQRYRGEGRPMRATSEAHVSSMYPIPTRLQEQ